MSSTNTLIFNGLKIITWIIFIGLCIEAGGLILNFVFSLTKPELVGQLYVALDLSDMLTKSKWAFFSMYSFILFIAILKVYLFYLAIRLVNKIDLQKPFNSFVSKQILLISYNTLIIGVMGYVARQSAKNLQHKGFDIDSISLFFTDSRAFILMAAIIYIIAVIFSKGVAYQDELEDTV